MSIYGDNTLDTFNNILQFHILDQASQAQPDVWWWIKADGCDVLPGLGESVSGIWSGDVDHNNGALQS